ARTLIKIAAVSPPRSLPKNIQFLRLCGPPHKRNYAGLGIMRRPTRHTAPRPLVSASTGPPPAGSVPHNLDALLGVLSLPRESSHARNDLPTPPSPPSAPGQPAR